MKKGTRTVILIVVLVLVFLFGVGQFFASSSLIAPQGGTASSTSQTSQGPATQVITYVPTPASSTPVESGSCWTNSIAAPYRTDAWRCSVGNSIQDPCFEISNSANLLCGMNPANPSSTSSFVLKLTQPLPQAGMIEGGTPSNWAWLIQLSDGTLCSPFTGTLPPTMLNGQTAGYGCAPGPLGNNLVIFGGLNNSSSEWTALLGNLGNSTSGPPIVTLSSTIPVAAVWQ
jgi:hypothetical protein